ncbi:MAG: CBS domain-containing protein [Candidatus Thorarchaeota archaeon]
MSPARTKRKDLDKRRKDLLKKEVDRIRFQRKKAHLTQEELSEEVGVSQAYIGRLESGTLDPKLSIVTMILDVLGRHTSRSCVDIMSDKPVTVSARETVSNAVKIMRRRGYSQLPVLRGGQIIGIITEHDIVRNLGHDLSEVTVAAVMSPGGVPTVDELAPVEAVLPLFDVYQAVVVVKQGRVRGIITRSDLIRLGV